MATLVLTVARAAAQAYAAHAIARAFAPDVEGPRTPALHVMSSTEGAPIPIVYGRTRLAGQIIWAADFTEYAETSSAGGGKGGPRRTDYRYTASFAVGLCEGAIDGIGRVWADGRLLDLSGATYRVYTGEEDQTRDPLIEAVEGAGDPPAFRGLAYVVFEDLGLGDFGNRIPQLTFEVFRAPRLQPEERRLEELVQGVTMIPGSGEFAYATSPVVADLGYGREQSENAQNSRGAANIERALDDLQAQLPNCRSVMLVVSWFGDDLRCGICQLRPGVETADKDTRPYDWRVNGLDRISAYVVSTTDGRPTYGGTPADEAVLEAIAAIKARGLAVGLYPFVLMDVPAGNGLVDPYSGAEQAAFPWRGRITCYPAAGEAGSPDKTAAAASQVAAFFGTCAPGDFAASGTTVAYSGPVEWGLRRMVLHYAQLAAMAGGVDAFLIGSELRGLTQVRDGAASYPAVAALKTLAGDARTILGAGVKIAYAADWSEYFGHQPQDGSGDVFFHLDPLWADAAIDFVGIDWYAPLADWRDGDAHLDAATYDSVYDPAYLAANVEGGEGYDWHYASDADRASQTRTAITDSAGKPWVFRYKDLRAWWNSAHYDRPGGVESATPTAWVPESKPIWFVETGCPAVDKGANQPNVFVDPKSSESFLPYFSDGARDDLIQRRYLETLLDYWSDEAGHNPTSAVTAEPMIALDKAHAWTWDARPFPDFPAREDVWSDGGNWRLGHWLTGRVGLAPLAAVVADIAGRTGEIMDVSALEGLVSGYVIDRPMSARDALEPLAQAFGFHPAGGVDGVAFRSDVAAPGAAVDLGGVVLDSAGRRIERLREDVSAAPAEARLRFVDETRDYRVAAASARVADAGARPALDIAVPLTLDPVRAAALARAWLVDAEAGSDVVRVTLPAARLDIEAGDVAAIAGDARRYRVERLDEGGRRAALLRAVPEARAPSVSGGAAGVASPTVDAPARPFGAVLDLGLLSSENERGGPLVAVAADPWPGAVGVYAGADAAVVTERARVARSAAVGALLWDLYPGPIGRWDEGNYVRIRIYGASIASASKADVLAGANLLAVEAAPDVWEALQFREATLVDADTYEIRGLLRGRFGGDADLGAPTAAGATVVVLDAAVTAAPLAAWERGATLAWRFAPAGRLPSDAETGVATAVYAGADIRPLTPVHLRVRRTGGEVIFSWRRRTRVGGDDWESAEVPLGEDEESYQFTLYDGASAVLTEDAAVPEIRLTDAEEAALFADAPRYAFEIDVRQRSVAYGLGAARKAWVYV